MLHIAICDDEQSFVDHLNGLIRQYAVENSEEIKVTPFYDGLDLIEKYDPTIDLIFLDIQMKLVDGLRTAEKIRQKDEKVGIIFLTTLTGWRATNTRPPITSSSPSSTSGCEMS